MTISTKGRYGLRLLIDIAMHQQNGVVKLKDIAERQNVSVKYLWQVANPLKGAGLLRASRGASGGFFLAKENGRDHHFRGCHGFGRPFGAGGVCAAQRLRDNRYMRGPCDLEPAFTDSGAGDAGNHPARRNTASGNVVPNRFLSCLGVIPTWCSKVNFKAIQ